MPGLQWTVTDTVALPITQWTILSPVSSLIDPIGVFSSFSVYIRRLLKSIWTKNGQHFEKNASSNEEAELLIWRKQLPILAETGFDQGFDRGLKPNIISLAHPKKQFVQWHIYVRNRKNNQLS